MASIVFNQGLIFNIHGLGSLQLCGCLLIIPWLSCNCHQANKIITKILWFRDIIL
jgi:hypothetical protein